MKQGRSSIPAAILVEFTSVIAMIEDVHYIVASVDDLPCFIAFISMIPT